MSDPRGEGGTPPLSGVRVVEWGRFITAPYAAMLLADMGADVIKVEALGGDPFRQWSGGGMAPRFRTYNRNKSSLRLDVVTREGQALLKKLVCGADVFVHNIRSSIVRSAGLDYETLGEQAPGLVYCAISGTREWPGRDSPPAYDATGQALSGLTSVLSADDRLLPVGPALSDLTTGLFAALGSLAGVVKRSSCGEGCEVRTTMVGSTAALVAEMAAYYFATGSEPHARTRVHNSLAFTVRSSDRLPIAIQLSTQDSFWEKLTEALEAPGLAADPRYATYANRVEHYQQLEADLAVPFGRRPRDEWLDRLAERGVPCAPVMTVPEAFAADREPATRLVDAFDDSGEERLIRCPVEIPGMAASNDAPGLGQGGVESLARWGLPRRLIDSALAAGTIRLADDER